MRYILLFIIVLTCYGAMFYDTETRYLIIDSSDLRYPEEIAELAHLNAVKEITVKEARDLRLNGMVNLVVRFRDD